MPLIDAHCHLADPRIGGSAERMIESAQTRGIGVFVQGGVDPDDWQRQTVLKAKFPGRILTAFGLHPWWVAAHREDELEWALASLRARIAEADAFGEMGLDYSKKIDQASYPLQVKAFEAQLEMADRLEKPLILHVVHAHEEALDLLGKKGRSYRGLVHSFSASYEIAGKYLDLGFHLSISGVITRKGFETLKRAVVSIPADRLVLETDSPDQIPESWGQPCNEPVTLFQVADAVGSLRKENGHLVLERSSENVRRMFDLK